MIIELLSVFLIVFYISIFYKKLLLLCSIFGKKWKIFVSFGAKRKGTADCVFPIPTIFPVRFPLQ